MQGVEDALGLGAGDFGGDVVNAEFLEASDAAETAQEFLSRTVTNSGDFGKGSAEAGLGAALTVEGDREAMSFVANLLDQMQHRRMMVEDHGLIFTTENVENLFFLGDAGHRLIDDGEFVEGFGGGVELADAAVNQDQAG